jgi:2-aminoethylphosphonate-pyruvate transaminase
MTCEAETMPNDRIPDPKMREPFLLTPGPLTTSERTKRAMLRDWGSWDGDFRAMTRSLRDQLLALIGPGAEAYDCVPIQGSGSYAVEAMLGSFVPKDGRVLVLANGAYGLRAAETLKYLGRDYIVIDKGDYLPPRGSEVAAVLAEDPAITHVMATHCETSSGILNPIEEIAAATRAAGRKLLIDSMSAFGAVPLHPAELGCVAFVSSANKCIEGAPGFGFIIAEKAEIEASKGNSHSLSLAFYASHPCGCGLYGGPCAAPRRRRRGGARRALCAEQGHSGVGHARPWVRDVAGGSLAEPDHRDVLLPLGCGV